MMQSKEIGKFSSKQFGCKTPLDLLTVECGCVKRILLQCLLHDKLVSRLSLSTDVR